MVILPTVKHSRTTTTNKITFFSKTISFLQQQAATSVSQRQAAAATEEEERNYWEKVLSNTRRIREASWRLQEARRASMKTVEASVPRKGIKLVPCLPLVDEEVIDVDKTFLVSFSLKIKPNGSNEHTYKKTVRRFSEGSPSQWLQTLQDIKEIWSQNKMNGPQDRAATVRTILRDDALTVFEGSLESQTETTATEEGTTNPMTNEKVDKALAMVSASVFPHQALETQKLWMRRHMKKPSTMSYRLLQAKVLKMNRSLVLFPEGSEGVKFSNHELLEILEFALPASWRAKFDLDSYIPTKHDRNRLLAECEAIERNEKVEHSVVKPKNGKRKEKEERATSQRAPRSLKLKFCSEHGPNTTHSSDKCWILHPTLKPSKFDKAETFPRRGKAMKAMLQNTSKSELLSMIMQSQKTTTPPKEKSNSKGGKAPKKRAKVEVAASDSSDESVQMMDEDTSLPSEDEETPPPSDDEVIKKSSKKKQKRISQLGQAEE